MSTTKGLITIRLDGGADVGSRQRLNLIQGVGVTIAPVDDPANKEIDITFDAVVPPPETVWLSQFFPAVDPDTHKGTYAAVTLIDDVDTPVYQTFMLPTDIVTVDTAVILLISDATGNLYWDCATSFAGVCVNEDFETHTDSIAANAIGVDVEQVECIDISAALTGAVGDDVVGIRWTRQGSHANDTVNADCYYLGILIKGSI